MASSQKLHPPIYEGRLTLGSIFNEAGTDPNEVLLVRHTFKKAGLTGPDDLTPAKIMAYIREHVGRSIQVPENATSHLAQLHSRLG